jgi:uncharacterized protein (TIGR02118 family)
VIKLFTFLRRKPELSHEGFCEYWQAVHAPLVLGAQPLARYVRRYVQNHAIMEPAISGFPVADFDGVGEFWFESVEDLTAVLDGPYRDVIAPSIDRISDRAATIVVAAEESAQFDRGFGDVKFIGLSKRPASMAHDQWLRYWIEVHGPLAHGVPEFTRYYGKYVHNYVIPIESDLAVGIDDYDGIVEEWLPSVEDFAACLTEPRYLEIVRPDELKFVDIARSRFVLATEHVITG